jgi:hypothetical protein
LVAATQAPRHQVTGAAGRDPDPRGPAMIVVSLHGRLGRDPDQREPFLVDVHKPSEQE